MNLARAALDGLARLETPEQVAARRGKKLEEIMEVEGAKAERS